MIAFALELLLDDEHLCHEVRLHRPQTKPPVLQKLPDRMLNRFELVTEVCDGLAHQDLLEDVVEGTDEQLFGLLFVQRCCQHATAVYCVPDGSVVPLLDVPRVKLPGHPEQPHVDEMHNASPGLIPLVIRQQVA